MEIKVIYDLLTRMPLLQGINGLDLARLEEHAGLQIEAVPPLRHPLIRQGQTCRELVFLVSGRLVKQMKSADGVYETQETVAGPTVIEPEKLYGLHCAYSNSYFCEEECQVMHVEKADVGKYLMKSEIFRMNYLNLISAKVSRLETALQFRKQGTPLQKVIDFILANFTSDEGEKLLTIKMNDLAEYLDETRLTVSNALNQLEASHVVSLRRKEVHIPDISSLKKYRNEHFS